MNQLKSSLSSSAPHVLSVLRIIAGLLFLQHGLVKLFGFPMPFGRPVDVGTLIWFQALIEVVGGILLTIGLFTRCTAFVLSGDMAVAYFMSHAPGGFYPIQNRGELAVLYCFVFFYLIFAGAGRWSIDGARGSGSA